MADRAVRPPLEGEREAPFALRAGDGWTLDGYGAVFNRPTIIDSSEGRFKEQVAPGSMRKSFTERPPKVQYDHGHHPLIGSLPIATLERAAEEVDPVLAPDGGAHIVARMIPHLFFEPIREAIANGAINGMSFRFTSLREVWHDPDGVTITDERALVDWLRRAGGGELRDDELPTRTLKELRVPECGPVAWPAYEDTSVTMRSSTIIDLGRLHEDCEQRKLFAKAMWSLADTKENQDAPRSAAPVAVASHPSDSPDAPPVTAPAVDEHPSQTPTQKPRGSRAIDMALRNMRDTLLSIDDSERQSRERRIGYPRSTGRAAFRPHPDPLAKREAARRDPQPRRGARRTR